MMLERCVELKPYILRLCREFQHVEWFPTEGDWEAAVWLISIIRPLKELSDRLEMCHDVTLSLVSIVGSFTLTGDSQSSCVDGRLQAKDHFRSGYASGPEESTTSSSFGRTTSCSTLQKLEQFFSPDEENLSLHAMLIATFLDPRHKGLLLS
jgi:hypothetical protein